MTSFKQIGKLVLLAFLLSTITSMSQTQAKGLFPTFGDPVDLGDAVIVPLAQGVAIGQNAAGENEVYFATNGTPAMFNVIDAENGKLKFSQSLPGLEVVWAITVAPDGDVYFAGSLRGQLLRYLPDEMKIEELGRNPAGKFVWDLVASNDGKIYGAVYPGAKMFAYDIKSHTFRDLGTIKPGQQYVRGSGISDHYLYAGIGSTAYLYRIDLETYEKREMLLPFSGKPGFIHEIQVFDHKLFVKAPGGMHVIDEETEELITIIQANGDTISSPSPYNPNLVYYNRGTDLYSYNMATNNITKIDGIPALPEGIMQTYDWIILKSGEKQGKAVLAGVTNRTECFLYDPEDNCFELIPMDVVSQGVPIKSLETGPDGNLYIGGYQGGMSIFNPVTEEIEHSTIWMPQPEGMGFLNGDIYFGTYGGAVIYRYDPTKPFKMGDDSINNPGLACDIPIQDRPFTFDAGCKQLFVGTVPGYGKTGGALTVYDQLANTWTHYQNIVQDQSIIGLAYKDGKLFGSTSIWGGLGGDALADEAKIFVWDPEEGKKIAEFTPNIPNLDATAEMIGELSFGPDGLLWGAAYGTIFAMNPETYEVVKSKVIHPTYTGRHNWIPVYLRWGEDGFLYTTLGRKLTIVDPQTLAHQTIRDGVYYMTLANGGTIYYTVGSELFKLPLAD